MMGGPHSSARVVGRARLSAAARVGGQGRGEGEGKGEIGEMGRLWAQRGRERFLGFFFFRKTIKLCLMLDNYYLCSKNSTKI